jgi:ATP diphosphatase
MPSLRDRLAIANDKFSRRFEQLEQRFAARGEKLEDSTLAAMESEWRAIKDDHESASTEGKPASD